MSYLHIYIVGIFCELCRQYNCILLGFQSDFYTFNTIPPYQLAIINFFHVMII